MAVEVKALRSRLGLTQEQLAAEIIVTFSTVNRWENGRNKSSPLAIKRIEELDSQRNAKWVRLQACASRQIR